jgi:subtilase family serine protease
MPPHYNALTPAQVVNAYNINQIYFKTPGAGYVKGDGTGQTIAIVDPYHDPNLYSDLQSFDSSYNLPSANLKVINQNGDVFSVDGVTIAFRAPSIDTLPFSTQRWTDFGK